MSQIASKDIAQAISETNEEETSGTVLTPEQVRGFADIVGESDPELKSKKISDTIESLLSEVENGSNHLKQLLTDFGIEDGQVAKFMESERFDSESRGQVKDAMERFQTETISQVTAEADQCVGVTTKSSLPRRNRTAV